MITTLGKNQVASLISGAMDKMTYRIDGVDKDLLFALDEVTDNKVVFAGLVPEAEEGLIDRVQLVNTGAGIFAERIENINKPAGRFLTLKFAFTITEEVLN